MDILYPSLEQLVLEIESIDDVWRQACQLFGETASIAVSYQKLKTCLQVRLLKKYAPVYVYLLKYQAEAGSESVYRLCLRQMIADRIDVSCMPLQVAQAIFTSHELKKFTQL